jgi:hypothetical protein
VNAELSQPAEFLAVLQSYVGGPPFILHAQKASGMVFQTTIQGWFQAPRPELLPAHRPASRHAQPVDTSTSLASFRRIVREGARYEVF